MLPEAAAFKGPGGGEVDALFLNKIVSFAKHLLEESLDLGQACSFCPLFSVEPRHVARIDLTSSVKASLVILIVKWEIGGDVAMMDQILHDDQVIDAVVHQLESVDVGEDGAVLIFIDLKPEPNFVELINAIIVERTDIFGCRF